MENKDTGFTNREGEKLHVSVRPDDAAEQLRAQEKEDFKFAQEILKGLKSSGVDKNRDDKNGAEDPV